MKSEKVTFEGHAGTLAARLDSPAGAPKAYALFAHCFTCSKDVFAASRIAAALADSGIATLRFDFTGLGASDGEFANTNFTSNIEDLLKAAGYLRAEHAAPRILIGHSLGGAAVLAAAGEIEEARAVATIAAPFDPGHVLHHFRAAVDDIEAEGEAEVKIAGRPFRVQKQFLEDIKGHSQEERIRNLKKPLLVFHAPRDEIVGIENAGEIFTAAKHPKSFVSLDDADHLLTNRADAQYVARVLAAWASRYVDGLGDQDRDVRTSLQYGAGDTVVAEAHAGKFAQNITSSGHWLRADEPEDYGGNDTGPTPYGFLLAALGSCTTMTMRMYANHKNLPLDHVSVRLSHEKIHASDCKDCETTEGKLDNIVREIEIIGDDLTDEQRQRLLEMADKCPVHRTLHSEVKIQTSLKE